MPTSKIYPQHNITIAPIIQNNNTLRKYISTKANVSKKKKCNRICLIVTIITIIFCFVTVSIGSLATIIFLEYNFSDGTSHTTPIHSNTSTMVPTYWPSVTPSIAPSKAHSKAPTFTPSRAPTSVPSSTPSRAPSSAPTSVPSNAPSIAPSSAPTSVPSSTPSHVPSHVPSSAPSSAPTYVPSYAPTMYPTMYPTIYPTFYQEIIQVVNHTYDTIVNNTNHTKIKNKFFIQSKKDGSIIFMNILYITAIICLICSCIHIPVLTVFLISIVTRGCKDKHYIQHICEQLETK